MFPKESVLITLEYIKSIHEEVVEFGRKDWNAKSPLPGAVEAKQSIQLDLALIQELKKGWEEISEDGEPGRMFRFLINYYLIQADHVEHALAFLEGANNALSNLTKTLMDKNKKER